MFHIPYVRVISTPPTLYTEDLVTRDRARHLGDARSSKRGGGGGGTIVQRR